MVDRCGASGTWFAGLAYSIGFCGYRWRPYRIPEEELREIVAKAIDDFKAPRQTGDRFNRDIKPSPLEEYVGKAITGLLEKAVAKHIDAALDVTLDEHGQRVASEIIQKAVNDAAPMMIEHFVKNAGTMTAHMRINHLRNDLRNSGVRF